MAAARMLGKGLLRNARPLAFVAPQERPRYQLAHRSFARRPSPARFVENSLISDLMPLLMPSDTALERLRGPTGMERFSLRKIMSDVVETDTGYEIKCDLPGVSKEDIKVDHSNDVLNISVEQKNEKEEEKEEAGVVVHRMERSSSFAKRSMRLPDHADFSRISAKYVDGVLTVRVPKKEKMKTDETRVLVE